MKRGLTVLVLLLVSAGVMADDMNDAFNTGSSYGKDSAGQGTSDLNSTGVVSGAIPGYTSSPSQSSSYGGVTGSDGGIADKGQQALSTDDAASAVISSGNTNPAVTIDPDAPYITNGKSAEDNADSIADGTNSQCTTSTVSKSTFENYTCDHDVATVETCARTGSIKVTGTTETYNTQLILNAADASPVLLDDYWVRYDFTAPADGVVSSGTWEFLYPSDSSYHGDSADRLWYSIKALGYTTDRAKTNRSGSFPIASQHITKGQTVSLYLRYDTDGNYGTLRDWMVNQIKSGKDVFRVTLPLAAERDTTTSQVVWSESCGFDKSKATSSAGTTCVDPGGQRTTTVNGKTYTQSADCWEYSDAYVVPVNSVGTCGSLIKNSACTESSHTCTETTSGTCTHESETWQCQTVYSSSGLLCGGTYFCQTGDCSDTNGAGDNGFDTAVAKLAGLASAGDDIKNDQVNVKAFTGEAMSCRKAAAGFSNCCKDSGWGQDVGLMQCNSDEKALAAAKAKKITVSVGERCDHKVLGVCIQKSQVYCVFGGKLARIIQEQGRRDQLGIGFGSGDSPNCAGITVPQLQSINFDKINFSDFYSDLMNNQKIPNTDSMVAQVKQKIAAQVNQTTGGTTK